MTTILQSHKIFGLGFYSTIREKKSDAPLENLKEAPSMTVNPSGVTQSSSTLRNNSLKNESRKLTKNLIVQYFQLTRCCSQQFGTIKSSNHF